jgi:hypothetical protein
MSKKGKAAATPATGEKAANMAATQQAPETQSGNDWDTSDDPEPETKAGASEFDGPVNVRCIVHTRPWTHEKALDFEEEAEVPADVAKIMLKKKQVELV